MSKILTLIPSRLSARRLPGKPLLKINGLEIINHVYNKAIQANIGDVYVVTGDKKIFKAVKKYGGKCILTKKKHRTGSDRIFEGLKKLNKKKQYKYILNLQGDEPLLSIKDIRKLVNKIKLKKLKLGTMACYISDINDFKNRNVVKVSTENKLNSNNSPIAKKFYRIKNNVGKNIYHHIGIYIYKVDILHKFVLLKQTKNELKYNLEQLRAMDNHIPIHVVLAKKKAVGIDTKKDFIKVKKILELK